MNCSYDGIRGSAAASEAAKTTVYLCACGRLFGGNLQGGAARRTACHFEQRTDVENQRDAAVAENARAGDALDVLKVFGQRLNDDVLLAEQVVDFDPELRIADADFGYVGSGPGKITLYKGKEVVKKNVNSEVAVDELINLLKESEVWIDA